MRPRVDAHVAEAILGPGRRRRGGGPRGTPSLRARKEGQRTPARPSSPRTPGRSPPPSIPAPGGLPGARRRGRRGSTTPPAFRHESAARACARSASRVEGLALPAESRRWAGRGARGRRPLAAEGPADDEPVDLLGRDHGGASREPRPPTWPRWRRGGRRAARGWRCSASPRSSGRSERPGCATRPPSWRSTGPRRWRRSGSRCSLPRPGAHRARATAGRRCSPRRPASTTPSGLRARREPARAGGIRRGGAGRRHAGRAARGGLRGAEAGAGGDRHLRHRPPAPRPGRPSRWCATRRPTPASPREDSRPGPRGRRRWERTCSCPSSSTGGCRRTGPRSPPGTWPMRCGEGRQGCAPSVRSIGVGLNLRRTTMPRTRAYAALTPKSPLAPYEIDRRPVGPHDVVIDILFCGVCHSDIHQARDEWGESHLPDGARPRDRRPGRRRSAPRSRASRSATCVGVGCMVDSCRTCDSCAARTSSSSARRAPPSPTTAPRWTGRRRPTAATRPAIVVDETFVLTVPAGLDPAGAAPLLCAGITTYSPLRHWKVRPGDRVGVVGLGGLGHMAVKLAASMGAEVTVLSHLARQGGRRRRLGAHAFALTSRARPPSRSSPAASTSSSTPSRRRTTTTRYLGLLRARRHDGAGRRAAGADAGVSAFSLIVGNRRLAGSLIGGIAETQEMLDFCAAARHRLRRRGHPGPEDQRGLRAHAQGRRALPLRHRHREPEEGPRMDVA